MADQDSDPGPLALHHGEVLPAWIDYNGHMNLAYYVLAFDQATDAFFDHIGLDAAYRAASGCTTYALEIHVTYARELKLGEAFRVTTQLIDHDARRLHYFHAMYQAVDAALAATIEIMSMHIDAAGPRACAMPAHLLERLGCLQGEHDRLPRPAQVGQVIGIRRRAG